MKSLVVLFALVSITLAVPAYQDKYRNYYSDNAVDYLRRDKKSALPTLSTDEGPKDEAEVKSAEEHAEERTFKKKKHDSHHSQESHIHHHYPPQHHHGQYPGHHFRDNEENTVMVAKEAIEETKDNKDKKITTSIVDHHRDVKKNINIAKEAVDTIKNNFEEISKSSSGIADWKNPESDKTFHTGLQTAKDALEVVHKSFDDFENPEVSDAITSETNDAPVQIAKMTEERSKHWKGDLHDTQAKNVESASLVSNLKPEQENKVNEDNVLPSEDQDGQMSERIDNVVHIVDAPIAAPLTDEKNINQKSAVSSKKDNEKIVESNKPKESDFEMKSAHEAPVAPENKNLLTVPKENLDSKAKNLQLKPNSDLITKQHVPIGKSNENDQILTQAGGINLKPAESKLTNTLSAPMSAPKSALSAPQPSPKPEGAYLKHDAEHLKPHPQSQARGAYNLGGGAGAAYGAAAGHAAGGQAAGPVVGVFPNANIGGCAIPYLLSCSPSVVPGSLAKYPSAGGSSYGAPPAYRGSLDARMIEKRNTKMLPSY